MASPMDTGLRDRAVAITERSVKLRLAIWDLKWTSKVRRYSWFIWEKFGRPCKKYIVKLESQIPNPQFPVHHKRLGAELILYCQLYCRITYSVYRYVPSCEYQAVKTSPWIAVSNSLIRSNSHILTSKVLSWTKVVFVKHRIFNTLSLQQDMLFAETKNFSKLSGIWLSSRLSVDLVSNSLFLVSVLPRPKSLSSSSVLLTTCPASSSNPSSSEASSQNIRDAGQWYWQVQQSHLPHHVFLFPHDLLDYLPQHIGRNSWGPRLLRIKTLLSAAIQLSKSDKTWIFGGTDTFTP